MIKKNRCTLAYFIAGFLITWSTQAMLTLNENHTTPASKKLQIQKLAPKNLSLPSHGYLQKSYDWAKSLLPTLSFETKQRIRHSARHQIFVATLMAITLPTVFIASHLVDPSFRSPSLSEALQLMLTIPITGIMVGGSSAENEDYEPSIDVDYIKDQIRQHMSHLSLQEKLDTLQQERNAHIAAHATDRFLFLNEKYYDILKAYDELITETPPAN